MHRALLLICCPDGRCLLVRLQALQSKASHRTAIVASLLGHRTVRAGVSVNAVMFETVLDNAPAHAASRWLQPFRSHKFPDVTQSLFLQSFFKPVGQIAMASIQILLQRSTTRAKTPLLHDLAPRAGTSASFNDICDLPHRPRTEQGLHCVASPNVSFGRTPKSKRS